MAAAQAAAVFAVLLMAGAVSAFGDHDLGSLPECVHSGCAQKLLLKQFAEFCDDSACRASCPLITSKLCSPVTACAGPPPDIPAGSWRPGCFDLPIGKNCTAQCASPTSTPPVATCTPSGAWVVEGQCPPNQLDLDATAIDGQFAVGSRVELDAVYSFADGGPIPGAKICFSTSPAYALSPVPPVVTNAEGIAATVFVPTAAGQIIIGACPCKTGGSAPADCTPGEPSVTTPITIFP